MKKKPSSIGKLALLITAAGILGGLTFSTLAPAGSSGFGTVLERLGAAIQGSPGPTVLPAEGTIEVAFSPDGGATAAIVEAIGEARESILVQAFSFTSRPIGQALVKAHERGVEVKVILDKSQSTDRYSSATYLSRHDIPVWIDSRHAIAHNKIMVVDGRTVITGSFNFTRAAEDKNAENVLILRGNPELAQLYVRNWRAHWAHSDPYQEPR